MDIIPSNMWNNAKRCMETIPEINYVLPKNKEIIVFDNCGKIVSIISARINKLSDIISNQIGINEGLVYLVKGQLG